MCIFHKWKVIKVSREREVEIRNRITGSSREVPAVIKIEKCSKCSKQRAYIEIFNGEKEEVSLWYAEKHID